jgi:small GTP-binding protein
MLRQVFIIKDQEPIFSRTFGKALDDEGFAQILKQISAEAFKVSTEKIQFHDYFKYKISYLAIPDKNLLFMFVSDLSDKFQNVQKELKKCKKEFMEMFGMILDEKLDEDTFEIFDPTIETIHKNLRPKISLVGFSGVGKTTITRLITAEEIPTEHIPTITGDIGTIKIGKLFFHLWDFAGQEQFSFLWNNFIKGSDAVLLITDSTLENCEKSKYFIELIKKESPYAHMATIGNKQDLPDAMPIADIERHLGTKAYSMIATDRDNRDKMITIIADVLEMSGEVSPLLKPLIDRDNKMKEAEAALESGNFQFAVGLFEELADLSMELGDDRVSQDFHEKAQKIANILKKSGPSAPAPGAPQPAQPAPPSPKLPGQMVPPAPKLPGVPTPNVPALAPPAPSAPVPVPPVPSAPVPIPPVPSAPMVIPPVPSAPVPIPPAPSAPMVIPPVPSAPVPIPPAPSAPMPIPPVPQAPIPTLPIPVPPGPRAPPPPTPAAQPPRVPTAPVTQAQKPPQLDQLSLLLQKLKQKGKAPAAPPVPAAPVGRPSSVLGASSSMAQTVNPNLGHVPPALSVPIPPAPVAPGIPPVPAPAAPIHVAPAPVSPVSSNIRTDIKIKIANVNKTLLDIEMQNITGEMSDEDFQSKSDRLNGLKARLEEQLKNA